MIIRTNTLDVCRPATFKGMSSGKAGSRLFSFLFEGEEKQVTNLNANRYHGHGSGFEHVGSRENTGLDGEGLGSQGEGRSGLIG